MLGPPYERRLALALFLTVFALSGCGGSTKTSGASSSLNTGTAHGGKLPVITRTRTVDGTTETLYIHPHHAVSSAVTRHIVTGKLPRVGVVLVDGAGHALYAFVPDRGGPAACTGACAATWPPLRFTIEGTLDSSPALEESLVSAEPDPENHAVGDRIAKFAGRVVYTYSGDTGPGTAAGQGLHSYGGRWYLISPSGKLVTTPSG
jgi:predicted lipoprotein with Yx(FWY)xxD motif